MNSGELKSCPSDSLRRCTFRQPRTANILPAVIRHSRRVRFRCFEANVGIWHFRVSARDLNPRVVTTDDVR